MTGPFVDVGFASHPRQTLTPALPTTPPEWEKKERRSFPLRQAVHDTLACSDILGVVIHLHPPPLLRCLMESMKILSAATSPFQDGLAVGSIV